MNPIDVVIPWVDGSDPTWIKVHDQYTSDRLSDNHVSRYRAWDTFRYWFRAIEENAPWVRKIHFLTFGHYPKWLNIHHEKIHLVRHEDFIPKEYLPTFSSHVIELNLHRIPDLAEQFIYFNDDVYLNLPSQPDDFFENGLPKDAAVLGVIKNNLRENFMPYIMLNIMALINEKFDKKEVISKHWSKWINVKYGRLALNNLYLLPFGCFTGFRNFHSVVSYHKKTFEEVWEVYPDELRQTCQHKFRNKADVNQYLFRYWQLVSGRFSVMKPSSDYFTIGRQEIDYIQSAIIKPTKRVICINDDPGHFDMELQQKWIDEAFQQRYPNPSSFEIR